jgi:hypothetical protein
VSAERAMERGAATHVQRMQRGRRARERADGMRAAAERDRRVTLFSQHTLTAEQRHR